MPPIKESGLTGDKKLINDWALRLVRGRSFRERIYQDAEWDRFEGYFRHKYPRLTPSDHDVEARGPLRAKTDSIIAREARRMVPKVTFGIPYLRVRPLAGRTIVHAKVLERVINGILSTIHLDKELEKLALSAIQHGTSFLKVGYDSEFVPDYKQIFTQGYSDGSYDKKGKRREFQDNIFPGMPWVRWQHPKNVIYPEAIQDFGEARWVAFQYLRPLVDLKADKRLSNTEDLQPVSYKFGDVDPYIGMENPSYDVLSDMCLCSEVRDKESGMMYIFAENHNKVLYKSKDALSSIIGGKLPVHPLVFNINCDWAYGTSDVQQVEEELRDLMELRTQMKASSRLRQPNFFYRNGSIKKENLQRMMSGPPGLGIPVEGDPATVTKGFDMPPVGQDLVGESFQISSRIKAHFGSQAFDTFPSSRRTGSEVQGSQQDADLPVIRGREKVKDLVVEIGKDIANIVFNLWTEEAVVDVLAPVTEQVPGPDGQPVDQDVTKQVWVAFKGNELRGDFDYTIVPSSGRYQNTQESKSEALEMIKFFSQVPGINVQELLRQLGDRFDGLDVEKLLTQPANGAGSPMQMEQLQKMMGQQKSLQRQTPNL